MHAASEHKRKKAPSQAPSIVPKGTDWFGLAACVIAAVFVVAVSWFKLSSLDMGYHLAYGNHFLDTGEIVNLDPRLYPETAIPFINANWGSQIIMAIVERAAGATGLIALRLALIACVFAGIAWAIRRMGGGLIGVAAAWLLAGITAYERFSLRPELFSYAIMAVMLVLLVRGLRRWPAVIALVVLQLVWINLHSYFLVGILLTGAWLVGEGLRQIRKWTRQEKQDASEGSSSHANLRMLLIALLLQSAVCFVNPWHWKGATFPLTTLQFLHGEDVMGGAAGDDSASAWSEISEFQSPFSFAHQPICARTIHAYYVMLAVAAVGAIILFRRGQTGAALAIVVFFAMSTQMRRNIAQFALLAAPLAVAAIVSVDLPAVLNRLRKAGRWTLGAFLIALSLWWTYQLVTGEFYYAERRVAREFGSGYSQRTFPEGAASWLASQEAIETNLFVDYFTSSNALPWLPDRFKLYVDTNTFAVEDATLRRAFDVGLGKEDPIEFFNAYGINVALLHCGPDTEGLIRKLATPWSNWSLVYCDTHHVVFIRRTIPHIPILKQHDLTKERLNTEAWLDAAPTAKPARALSLNTMAGVPLTLGRYEAALTLLKEAVKARPDYYEAWTNLGMCHGMLANEAIHARQSAETIVRELKKGEACFKKALKIRPDYPIALINLQKVQTQLQPVRGGIPSR